MLYFKINLVLNLQQSKIINGIRSTFNNKITQFNTKFITNLNKLNVRNTILSCFLYICYYDFF